MKILDIPRSGKRGLNVSQAGRYGQISRALVIPARGQAWAVEVGATMRGSRNTSLENPGSPPR
jgi:hypothetical protein